LQRALSAHSGFPRQHTLHGRRFEGLRKFFLNKRSRMFMAGKNP